MAMPVAISQVTRIMGGSLGYKTKWVPDTEVIDGVEFTPIEKRNWAFMKFVSRDSDLRDANFLDLLKAKRNHAYLTSTEELGAFGTERQLQDKERRKLNGKLKASSPPTVEVHLPTIEYNGETAEALTMRIKSPTTTTKADGIVVQLTAANMHYIRIGMLKSNGNKLATRKRAAEESSAKCKWVTRKKKSGYIATRELDDGTVVSKLFFSNSADADATVLKEMAEKWIETGNVDRDDGIHEADEQVEAPNADSDQPPEESEHVS
jgi:hypothetical protein